MPDPVPIPILEIPDAALLVGGDGQIVAANAHAERVFGYGRGELAGLALERLIPESHAVLVEGFQARREARPMGMGRELRGLKRGGEEFPLEIAIGPTAGGSLAVVVIRDLSAVVQAQEELRESEQRFRIAASHATDVIHYVSVETDFFKWYGDIDSLMGYEPGGFPRTVSGWLELIHPDDKERIGAYIERVVDSGADGWDLRCRVRACDGSYRHWWSAGTVIEYRADGRVAAGYAAIVDETEQVLARQELEAALAEVEALKNRLEAESRYLQQEIKSDHDFEHIVGNSVPMRATLSKVEKVAPTDATVLVLGETGTGKELLARGIHSRGQRKERPLIKVDCGALPPGLVESELFGHAKGAFTGATEKRQGRFELADGGTIFLDEIGELPLELQTKLLRVLEEGVIKPVGSQTEKEIDVRVIAATNRDLKDEVEKGRFRSDLYYRLSVFLIESPPLRDRREDIPLLTAFFISGFVASIGRQIRGVSEASMDRLMSYDWPGNVRELRNVLERAAILCEGDMLEVEDLITGLSSGGTKEAGGAGRSLKGDLQAVERARILQALEASGWKIKGEDNAASRLGLKPSTLRARMKRFGIARP